MNKLWICTLALLALALPAAAGVGVWTPLGPDGGQVWALAVDPAGPDIVYAGTTHGIFKSTDGGETWAASSRGLGPQGVWVRALLAVPGAVYAGTQYNGLFKSTDGGQTWLAASRGLPSPRPGLGPIVGVLLQDPRQPNRIWAGTAKGLYSTTNGGASWTTAFKGDPFDNPVLGLAIDPANGQIFLSSYFRGVYTSTNQGKKWVKVSRNLNAGSYSKLVMDPQNRSTLFVGTISGLWRTDDRGGRWTKVPGLPKTGAVYAATWQGNRLFTGVEGSGIFYSDDRGKTWTPAQESPEDPTVVELAAGPDTLYAGTSTYGLQGGVFRSLDRGVTWQPARSGMDSLRVDLVAVDPSDPDVLYASAREAGLFKSTDRGATWTLLDVQDSPPHLRLPLTTLLVDPSDPSTVYGNIGFRLYRSRDAGATWGQLLLPVDAQALEADPRAPGALWAAGFPGVSNASALGHSDDFGETWETLALPEFLWVRAFAVDPKNPQVLWVAGGVLKNSLRLRVFRSADAGRTWQRRETGIDVPAGVSVIDLAIDSADPSRLYAATEAGLYRTTDAGLTWSRVPGLTGPVTEVETSPTTPTTVYAFLSGFGVLRSIDGGNTWTPARRGLAPIPVLDLIVDPTDPHRLYAGTETRSVFTYTEP